MTFVNRKDAEERLKTIRNDKSDLMIDIDASHRREEDQRLIFTAPLEEYKRQGECIEIGHLTPNIEWHTLMLFEKAIQEAYLLGQRKGKEDAINDLTNAARKVIGI